MGLLKSLTGGSGGGGGGRAGVANEAAANYGPTTTSSPNSPVPQQSPLLSEKWTLDSAIGSLNQSTTALSTDLTSPLAVGAAPLLPTTQTHDAEQTDQQRSTSGGGAGGRTLLAKRNRTRSPATGEHDGRHESESPIDIHANDLPLSASAVPSSTGRSRTTRFFSAPWTGFVGSASTTSATTTCPNLSDTHAAPTPQSRTVSNPIPVLNASDVATSSSSVGLTSPVLRATDIPSRSSSMMTVGVSSSSSSSMTPPATLWPNVSPALSPPPSSILPLSSPSSMSSSLLVGSRREKSLPPLPLHPAVAAARGDLLNGPLPSPPPPPNGIIITPSSPNGKVATATAKAVSGVIYEEELEREERLASSPSNSLFGRLGMGMGKYATNQVVLGAVDGDEAGTTALSRQNTVRPTTNATSTSNLAPRSTSDEASRTRKIRHVRSLGLGLGKPKLAREPSELSTITLRPSAADEAKNMHGHRSFTEPMPPAPISLGQNRTTSESTLTVPDGRATEKKSGLDSPGLRMNPTGFHVGGASQSRSPSPTPSGRSIKFLADRAEDSQEEAAPRAGSSSLNRAASRKLPLRKARSFSDIFSSPHSSSLRQAMQDDAPRPDASVVASVQVDGQQAAASPQLPFSKANKPTSSSSTNLFKSAANLLKRKKKDKSPDGAGNDGKPRSTRIGSADGTDISSWPNSIAASPNPADSSSTLPSFTATPSVFSPSLEPTTAAIPISRNQPLSQLPEHSPMVAMTPEDYFTANFNLGTSQGSQMASFFGQSVDSPAMSPGVDDSNGGTRRSSTSDWSSSNLRRTQGSTEASIDGSTGVAEGYKRRNGSATSEFLAPRPPHLNLAQSDSHRRRANTDTAAQSLTPNSQDFGSLFDGNGLSKRPSLSRRSNSANSAVLGRVKTVLSSTSLGRTATMRRQQSADYMSSPNASTTSLVSAPLAASRQTSFDGTPNTSSSHRIGLGITTPARMSIASSISSFGADTRRHAEAEDRPSRRKRSSTMFSAPTSHFGSTPPISGTPPRKRPSTPQRLSTALFGSSPSHRDDSLFPLPPRGARSSLSVSEDERSRSQPPPTPSVKDLPEINADEDIEHWLMRLRAVVARSGLLSALTLRNDSHFQSARHLYIRKFDFKTDALDVALRRLLLESSLPKESQQIDRVIEAFARRYVECHPDLFLDPDHPYVIAFSLMMLHTDVFNKHNKSKMSKADYVRNTRMEGLPPVVLETFYDNIAYTPFRHMEDDSDLRSLSRPSTASRRKSILTDTAPPIATKSDIYQLIASGTTSSLRVDFADCDLDDDPISYSGTHTSLDFDNLRQQAITASSMDVDKPKQRRRSGATLLPGNKAGAVDRDETPTRLKLFKVGLLSRKEDLAEDGRKSVSRRWRSWSVILTGSQLLFLKDASWALVLLEQLESGTLGRLQGFKPEEVLNLDGTVAVHDRSYNKHTNTFRLLLPRGAQILFQASDESEMNEWVSKINYASAYRTAGVRLPDGSEDADYVNSSRRGSIVQPIGRVSNETMEQDGLDQATVEAASMAQAVPEQQEADLSLNLRTPDPAASRLKHILDRIEAFNLERHPLVKRLKEEVRVGRNLSILTPFAKASRERIEGMAQELALQIRRLRLDVAKYTCWIEVLKDELRRGSLAPAPLPHKGRRRGLSDVTTHLSVASHSSDGHVVRTRARAFTGPESHSETATTATAPRLPTPIVSSFSINSRLLSPTDTDASTRDKASLGVKDLSDSSLADIASPTSALFFDPSRATAASTAMSKGLSKDSIDSAKSFHTAHHDRLVIKDEAAVPEAAAAEADERTAPVLEIGGRKMSLATLPDLSELRDLERRKVQDRRERFD